MNAKNVERELFKRQYAISMNKNLTPEEGKKLRDSAFQEILDELEKADIQHRKELDDIFGEPDDRLENLKKFGYDNCPTCGKEFT